MWDGKSVPLELLHGLLDIEMEDIDYWFLQLINAFGMANLRDVLLWDAEGELFTGKDIPWNYKDYKRVFSLEFATRVAMATPTYTGAQFHNYITGAYSPTANLTHRQTTDH
jgi:phage anti-repressor protein